MSTRAEVTEILQRMRTQGPHAGEELLPLLYDELRRLAEARMAREPAGHTLQATALVHEAYLRLLGNDENAPQWDSRGHFFAAAAEAMRRVLIDRARRVGRIRHGGEHQRVELGDQAGTLGDDGLDLLALDEALNALAAQDARKAEVVKLRFFAGLTLEEVAQALNLSLATIKNEWAFSRAWLHRAMQSTEPDS